MNRAEKRATTKAIKKAKPIKLAEAPTPEIPKDLSDKWDVVKQVATAHSLLQKGSFTFNWANAISNSLTFLMKLHETMVEDLLAHPEAHTIPELKEEIEKRAKDKADGKTN